MCQRENITQLKQELNYLLKHQEYKDTLEIIKGDLLKVSKFATSNNVNVIKYVDILQEFYYFVKRITDNFYLENVQVLKCTKTNWVQTVEEHGQILRQVFFYILLNKDLHQHFDTFFFFKSEIAKFQCSINNFLSKQFKTTLDVVEIHYKLASIKVANYG